MAFISDIVSHDTNTFYLYLFQNNNIDNMSIDLNLTQSFIKKIRNNFKFNPAKEYIAFYKNNLSYIYEKNTDNQICQRNQLKNIKKIRYNNDFNIAINAYIEQKLPCYMFPSTDELSCKTEYTIEDSKINNRITLNIYKSKNETCVYIMYKHNPNADIEHNEEIITNILKKL